MSLTAYCPTCAQDSLMMNDGRCAWCDRPDIARYGRAVPTPMRVGAAPRRGGGKPAGKWGRLSDDQIRAAHKLHMEAGISQRQLAIQLYRRFGYATATSCAAALSKGWHRLGLPVRDRIEATVKASTKHGQARRGARRPDYKRWLREQRGDHQPLCAGVRTQYPRKGEPCQRPAQVGSDFCISHDPARREEVVQTVARARTRLERTAA